MSRLSWCSCSRYCHRLSQTIANCFCALLDGDVGEIRGRPTALGEGLAEMLITELNQVGKFQVLESTAIQDLADEIVLGASGYFGELERVEKGGWAACAACSKELGPEDRLT